MSPSDEESNTQPTKPQDLKGEKKEENTISQKSHDDTSTSKQTQLFTTEVNPKITVDPVSTDLSHMSPPPSPPPVKTVEITPLSTTIDSPSFSYQRAEETFTQSKDLYSGEELNGENNPADGNSPASQITLTAKVQEDIQNLTEDEQLIKQVLGENMVKPFKNLLYECLKVEVIELVKQIQGILGEEAKNLDQWVHDDARDIVKKNKHSSSMWWF